MQDSHLFIFARYYALPDRAAALSVAIEEVVGLARTEEGCVAVNAFRSVREPRVFYIHSCWQNQEAFEAHRLLPHTTRFGEVAAALTATPADITTTRLL